jgi:hypothetical protein
VRVCVCGGTNACSVTSYSRTTRTYSAATHATGILLRRRLQRHHALRRQTTHVATAHTLINDDRCPHAATCTVCYTRTATAGCFTIILPKSNSRVQPGAVPAGVSSGHVIFRNLINRLGRTASDLSVSSSLYIAPSCRHSAAAAAAVTHSRIPVVFLFVVNGSQTTRRGTPVASCDW